jgi:hypothetical protein
MTGSPAIVSAGAVPGWSAPAPADCRDCAPTATGTAESVLVYAVGALEPRFPSLGVEREYEQLVGAERGVRPESELLLDVVARPENDYLARQLCWVLVVQGGSELSLSTSPAVDVDDLVAAAARGQVTFVSGWARSGGCLGIDSLDIVPAQLLTFTREEFTANLVAQLSGSGDEPADGGAAAPADTGAVSAQVISDLFDRILQRARNQGVSPDSRAVNYLALRAPAVYALVAEQLANGAVLVSVDAEHTHSGGRTVVDVRFVFRSRRTDLVSRYLTRVDVTEVFPFLVSPLQQSYDG